MLPLNPARLKQVFQQARAAQSAGRLDEALAYYAQVLGVRPDLAEAQFQVGQIHAARGKLDKAETAYRKALKSRPDEVAIWQALAKVLSGGKLKKLEREAASARISLSNEPDITGILTQIKRGDAEGAETAAFALVKQYPNAATPALALGAARAAQHKWGLALPALEKAVERAPASSMAHMLKGEVLLGAGQMYLAEQALRQAQDLGAPASVPMAKVMHETCRDPMAEKLLAQAVTTEKRNPRVLMDYGDALAIMRKPAQAEAAYAKAVSAGAPPRVYVNLAEKLASEGDNDAGLALCEKRLASEPDNAVWLASKGQIQMTLGQIEDGRETLMRAMSIDPNLAESYRSYVSSGKVRDDDPITDLIAARLADVSLSQPARQVLSFAMAKALEDLGRYDEVFDHLHRANRLTRAAFPYQTENEFARVGMVLQSFQTLQDLRQTGTPSTESPLFVTGLPRSGTTLVETILAAHSTVTAGGEMPYLRRALELPMARVLNAPDDLGDAYGQAGQHYLAAARRRSGATERFTDKAISTFSNIGHVVRALPEAKIFVLKRDPRDVGLSIYRNAFPPGRQLYAADLVDIGHFIKLQEALVDYWVDALPGRVRLVDYEALTADPEPHIRTLIEAAGLDWEDACLEPHKAKRDVATLSFAQVRQPIYRGSVAAWTRYENELAPLFEALEHSVSL